MRKLLALVLPVVAVVLVPSVASAHHEDAAELQLDYVGRCSILDDEEGHARLGGTVRLYYEEQSQQAVYSGVEVKWLLYRRFPATEDWELVRTTTQRTVQRSRLLSISMKPERFACRCSPRATATAQRNSSASAAKRMHSPKSSRNKVFASACLWVLSWTATLTPKRSPVLLCTG